MKTPFQITTKRFFWLIIKVGIVITFIACLMSCTKEDELSTPVEKVKIFISSPPSSSGLKSANTTEPVAITDGSTITLPFNVNTLMWAQDESGQSVSGRWEIRLEKNDYGSSQLMSINNYIDYQGDQIANKFVEHGIYKVEFKNFTSNTAVSSFYVLIDGVPGKVGDELANDFIFRMENKTVIDSKTNKNRNLVFVYFKYKDKPAPRKSFCFLNKYDQNGWLNFNRFEIEEWPFNKAYYYFIIDPASNVPGEYYRVKFVTSQDGTSGMVDPNNHISSWSNDWDGIKFAVQ